MRWASPAAPFSPYEAYLTPHFLPDFHFFTFSLFHFFTFSLFHILFVFTFPPFSPPVEHRTDSPRSPRDATPNGGGTVLPSASAGLAFRSIYVVTTIIWLSLRLASSAEFKYACPPPYTLIPLYPYTTWRPA